MASFILLLKEPQNSNEIKDILSSEEAYSFLFEGSGVVTKSWPMQDVAKIVFQDLEKISFDLAIEEMEVGSFYEMEGKVIEAENSSAHKALLRKLLGKGSGKEFLFLVRYSGEDESLARAMERGSLFQKVPHIRIDYQYALR